MYMCNPRLVLRILSQAASTQHAHTQPNVVACLCSIVYSPELWLCSHPVVMFLNRGYTYLCRGYRIPTGVGGGFMTWFMHSVFRRDIFMYVACDICIISLSLLY